MAARSADLRHARLAAVLASGPREPVTWPISGPDFEMPGATVPARSRRAAADDPADPLGPMPTMPTGDGGRSQEPDDPTGPQIGRAFLLAGRAVFTLQGRDARYTFRVARKDPAAGDTRPPVYFVSLLTGPDNTSDYTYLGMLEPATGAVRLTRASRYTDASIPVKAIRWALPYLWRGLALPAPARIYHMGRCGRCGRALTVPASVESGFGPECIGRIGE